MCVREWFLANYLTLNVSKSFYMILFKIVPRDLRMSTGQNVVERQSSGKFLGVILDEILLLDPM